MLDTIWLFKFNNNNLSKIWFILIYTIIFLWLRWHGAETFQFCAQVLLVVAVSSRVVLCLPSPQQQQTTKVNINNNNNNNNTTSADASTADEFFYDYGNYDERAGKATKTTKVLQIFQTFAGFITVTTVATMWHCFEANNCWLSHYCLVLKYVVGYLCWHLAANVFLFLVFHKKNQSRCRLKNCREPSSGN